MVLVNFSWAFTIIIILLVWNGSNSVFEARADASLCTADSEQSHSCAFKGFVNAEIVLAAMKPIK